MFTKKEYKTHNKQKGLALLILVIILSLAFISFALSDLSITQVHINQSENTLKALKEAKRALINYAVTYSDRDPFGDNDYGLLPYPETDFFNNNDGNTDNTVSGSLKNTNAIGWLPWRELDLPVLRDESGTCLFYAVSGSYMRGASVQADMVNEDSTGMFRIMNSADTVVQGVTDDSRVVALVIAPGKQLEDQIRVPTEILSSCGRDYGNVSAYLEGNVTYNNSVLSVDKDEIDDFIHATNTSEKESIPYNDRFLTITRDEIWSAIVERNDFKRDMESLTQGLAACMAAYTNLADNPGRRLAWPTEIDLGGPLNYRSDASYVDDSAADGYSGRYPFNVTNSNNAIDPVNLTEDKLFEIAGMCTNLGFDWEGKVIDLESSTSKYRKLWKNWKDHFFYILSQSYEPDNTGTVKTCADVGASCVTVNSVPYAGAVIFSGSRFAVATRNNKTILADYLEDAKSGEFMLERTNKTGARAYFYTTPQTTTENDIMYCIEDQPSGTVLSVVQCL